MNSNFWYQINIQTDRFDLGFEEERLISNSHDAGAIVVFQGMVRVFDQAIKLDALFLEHVPIVTEAEIEKIILAAHARWKISACRVIHRVGKVGRNEKIVLVIVAATHRQSAFESSEFIMDYLKTQAPFWKQAFFEDGSNQWVEAKLADDIAAQRW